MEESTKVLGQHSPNNTLRILAQMIAQKYIAEQHNALEELVKKSLENDDLRVEIENKLGKNE